MRVFNLLRAFNKGFVESKLIKKKVYLIGFSYIEQQQIISSINKIQKQTNQLKFSFSTEVDESDLFIINYDHSEKSKSFLKSFLLYVEPNNSIFISEKNIEKKYSLKLAKTNNATVPFFDGEQLINKLNEVSLGLD